MEIILTRQEISMLIDMVKNRLLINVTDALGQNYSYRNELIRLIEKLEQMRLDV